MLLSVLQAQYQVISHFSFIRWDFRAIETFMSEKKIENLEEALAHHEKQILDLSEMVKAQWDQIDILKARLTKMQGKVEELEENLPDGDGKNLSVSEQAARDKPPHY